MLLRAATLSCLGLAAAQTQIFLSPFGEQATSPRIDASAANALIAHHLSLSRYERLNGDSWQHTTQEPFSSNGQDALILLVQTSEGDSSGDQPSLESWQTLVGLYLRRFAHSLELHATEIFGADAFMKFESVFESTQNWVESTLHRAFSNDITVSQITRKEQEYYRLLTEFDVADKSARFLVQDFSLLDQYIESLNVHSEQPRVAAFDLKGLSEIAKVHGIDSNQFKAAAASFRQFLDAAIEAYRSKTHQESRVVLIATPREKPALLRKRSADPLAIFRHENMRKRQAPSAKALPTPIVPWSRKCFDSEDACTNATNSCSGHGACVAGIKAGSKSGSCFVCACSTINGTSYAGNVCEKEDISSSFFLIFWSAVLLIVVVGGSVGLLMAGDDGLPQVLELASKVE